MKLIKNDSHEKADWMHELPGYRDELEITCLSRERISTKPLSGDHGYQYIPAETDETEDETNTYKHLAGQHDQSTHGSWAGGNKLGEGKPRYTQDNSPYRAPKGGAFGINGEFYEGGQFLPNTTLPKLTPEQRRSVKYLGKKQEIEGNHWELPPADNVISLFQQLAGALEYDYRNNTFSLEGVKPGTLEWLGGAGLMQAKADAYNNGIRWVEKNWNPDPVPVRPTKSRGMIEAARKALQSDRDRRDIGKRKGMIDVQDDHIVLATPYHPEYINDIKTIPGAKWNPSGKYWSVDIEKYPEALAIFAKYFNQK